MERLDPFWVLLIRVYHCSKSFNHSIQCMYAYLQELRPLMRWSPSVVVGPVACALVPSSSSFFVWLAPLLQQGDGSLPGGLRPWLAFPLRAFHHHPSFEPGCDAGDLCQQFQGVHLYSQHGVTMRLMMTTRGTRRKWRKGRGIQQRRWWGEKKPERVF